jgi:hypothetical protein
LAIENGDWDLCEIAGVPPIVEDGVWREGFIVSRIVPFGMATSQPKGRHRRMGSGEVLGGGQQKRDTKKWPQRPGARSTLL